MALKNKNKDNLKDNASLNLIAPVVAPQSDDPLRFWTNHPTENTLVDLHEFAIGTTKSANPNGGGSWGGAFSGRPKLIAELAPALQARLALAPSATALGYSNSFRKFFRLLDGVENISPPNGTAVATVQRVSDLTHLHEAAMHRAKFGRKQFGVILIASNDARRLMGLKPLLWQAPKDGEPNRQLIPDSHAKELKIGIKRDWERVRKNWERHDAIRNGIEPDTLSEYQKEDPQQVAEYTQKNQQLKANWLHFERAQACKQVLLPTGVQLGNGTDLKTLRDRGLYLSVMRSIVFPTAEEAHIAFHAALMGSGWNPTTLITGIDATLPNQIFQHPKDTKQSVLMIDNDQEDMKEVTMTGTKRRSGGNTQYCMGLQKNPDAPPNIVAAFLARTEVLRNQLKKDLKRASKDLEDLDANNAPLQARERQFKLIQRLGQGIRNTWLYVDYNNNITWLDGGVWKAFYSPDVRTAKKQKSYIEMLTERLNESRARKGLDAIKVVTPSDFRDIYARWVNLVSGGNILAVMLALGHARLSSTEKYQTNNIFNAEVDETIRSFMTHLADQLRNGRIDLTILAHLVRGGTMNEEQEARLKEYRSLMRSRIKTACADIKNPPHEIDPGHTEGKWCGTHRCLMNCQNAKILPESFDGVAMRAEELLALSDHLPLDTWRDGNFHEELNSAEYLLTLFPFADVEQARSRWRSKIRSGKWVIPGFGFVHEEELIG